MTSPTSIFEQPPASAPAPTAPLAVPARPDNPKRVTDSVLRDTFRRLLGMSEMPKESWRAVGDPDALDQTVLNTVQWMERAVIYKAAVNELPNVPHAELRTYGADGKTVVASSWAPAPGTRSVFDACVEAFHGGLSPAEIQTCWSAAKRDVIAATTGLPGYRGTRR